MSILLVVHMQRISTDSMHWAHRIYKWFLCTQRSWCSCRHALTTEDATVLRTYSWKWCFVRQNQWVLSCHAESASHMMLHLQHAAQLKMWHPKKIEEQFYMSLWGWLYFLWQNKHHKARKTWCKNLPSQKFHMMLLLCMCMSNKLLSKEVISGANSLSRYHDSFSRQFGVG